MRISDWSSDVCSSDLRRLGSVPTTVPAPEVYTSLERGMVEAASFPFTYSHVAYKLNEISTWYTSNMAPRLVHAPRRRALPDWWLQGSRRQPAHPGHG